MRRMMLAVLVASLSAAAGASAQGTGRIEGVVKAADGKPLAGARVTITGTTLLGVADAQGRYAIEAIPVGTVQVEARFINYKPRALAGLRIPLDKTVSQLDFTLEPAAVTLRELAPGSASAGAPGLLLRFQLIRPIATRTTDKMLLPIDSVLRDLFQWPGYQLLAQSALTLDMPMSVEWGGTGASSSTQTMLNVEGKSYDLSVRVDTTAPPRVKMTVSLVGLTQAAASKSLTPTMDRKILLSTAVTVGLGRTVVLGSTQPGGGRGGMSGTLILTVSPAMRPPN